MFFKIEFIYQGLKIEKEDVTFYDFEDGFLKIVRADSIEYYRLEDIEYIKRTEIEDK